MDDKTKKIIANFKLATSNELLSSDEEWTNMGKPSLWILIERHNYKDGFINLYNDKAYNCSLLTYSKNNIIFDADYSPDYSPECNTTLSILSNTVIVPILNIDIRDTCNVYIKLNLSGNQMKQ